MHRRAAADECPMRSFLAPPPDRPAGKAGVPSFSVIIPTYEHADFVGEAVESVLHQTIPLAEVIVVDDGSTDHTERSLGSYAGRITLLRKEHGGPASARNAGMHATSGEFVVFLDADNVFLPEYLEAVRELAMQRPDLDIVTTDAYLELDGQIYGRYYRGKARFVVDDQRRGIIHQHFIFGNAALRRERLLAIGGYDESLVVGEDTDCFLRMILAGSRVGLVDEPLCVYRIRTGSLSSNRPRSLRAAVTVLERARNHPSLSAAERRFVKRELAGKRREAALAEAEEALRGLAPAARRRSLRIAFGPAGYGLSARAKALAATIAPRAAGRFLAAKERRTGKSRLATRTHGR